MLKVIFLLVILCPFVGAQTFRGALVGSVNDAAGAAVRACKIDAVNRATGRAHSAQTGMDGGFSLQELQPGSYVVTTDCPGFARVANSRVDVAISVVTTLRFTAQPATQSFSVTVTESIDPL